MIALAFEDREEPALSYRYGFNDILVLPQDLQDFAWSAPMRDLAARVGLSDVGLKKLLKSHGVVTPPQGYWNKLHAGRPVPKCPRAPARRAGETGRLRVDARFANVVHAAETLPSSGPFASVEVPEDLAVLHAQELRAIGRVSVPRSLERVHAGLKQILKQEQRRRDKFAVSGWSWDAPKFESAVDRRRLKILNAIFMALSRRGHGADAYERDGEIQATALVGDTRVGVSVDFATKLKTRAVRPRGTAAAKENALAFTIDVDFEGEGSRSWQDDGAGPLEKKLAEITAAIVVAGEEQFRRGLRWAEEQAEQSRRREEKWRQERIAARNAERLKLLRESGALLRQAEDLRALIARVHDAVVARSVNVDEATLDAWERWASAEADRLDPIRSGQVMAHLKPAQNDE